MRKQIIYIYQNKQTVNNEKMKSDAIPLKPNNRPKIFAEGKPSWDQVIVKEIQWYGLSFLINNDTLILVWKSLWAFEMISKSSIDAEWLLWWSCLATVVAVLSLSVYFLPVL